MTGNASQKGEAMRHVSGTFISSLLHSQITAHYQHSDGVRVCTTRPIRQVHEFYQNHLLICRRGLTKMRGRWSQL
jgi:hypothetical protein